MKFFGWKGAASSPRPALSRAYMLGGPAIGEWPVQYEAQVRAAVLANPVAQRAVRLVSEAVGGAALVANGGEDGASARLIELVRHVSGAQGLMETLALHLLLHGNAYVQIASDAEGVPVELFALRPDRVSVETDSRGWPVAYSYRAGQTITRFTSADGRGRTAIIHMKSINPLDDHYGLGCVAVASGAVAIHNAATVWNKALLDNAARPSGALVYDTGRDGANLSADQFKRLKEEMEAAFQGAGNAGKPMLLEGGLKWQSLSLSPTDMDFIGLKAAAARDIALAFGVPPMMLGLPGDSTYANYREANKALWRQTILPLADKILSGIGQGLADSFPGTKLALDLERVPELSDERSALWERVGAADFLTVDEKRAMLGLAPLTPLAAGEVT
ncbi:MAG: phage portal protein [Sphingobium sp.]